MKTILSSERISTFDKKSLKFKIWFYFSVFAIIIMAILWLLQTIFLDIYYQEMKSRELFSAAKLIETSYDDGNIDDLASTITRITIRSDMYIFLEDNSGIYYSSGTNSPRLPDYSTIKDLNKIKLQVHQSLSGYVTSVVSSSESNSDTMIYASMLNEAIADRVYLFIFAPLSPLESTIKILASQLIIVTIISIVIGIVMSLLITRRLTRPIENITDSAALLAEGHYDVHFEGGSYSEMIKLADTLNYTSNELAKSDKLKKDLIANVSHDLKTPLTMVKSYAEMIRDLSGDNPDKRNAHLNVIISESDRLNELVNDLTELSKMQANVELLEKTYFDLHKVAFDILDRFTFYPEAAGFIFKLIGTDQTYVFADEKRITQVLFNLINNAIRYSGEARIVSVRITENENVVKCEVIDQGPGIPEEEIHSIWDRYYRASSNLSRSAQGSGLGLSIVKQILMLHDADYGVESTMGKGSIFYFSLKKSS